MEREGSIRIPAGCAIAALISKEGRMIPGDVIIRGIATMHDRSNGLGGGFAAYGIYPEHRDQYALHIFFDSKDRRSVCEGILRESFEVVRAERIPTRKIPAITDEPMIWRYFVSPLRSVLAAAQQDEEEYMVRTVFAGLLITGPFSIILGYTGGMMALNDRLKLRSMVTGSKDDCVYIASEEAAIRAMEPDAENIYAPAGGEPFIVNVKEGCF